MRRPIVAVAMTMNICTTGLAVAGAAQQVTAELEVETRAFPRQPLLPEQRHHHVAFRLQPELYQDWNRGRTTLTIEPFLRVDATDRDRTHVDLRELSVVHAWKVMEVRLGIRTVFWGVTESQHLVDVINQTDFVENIDGEDKLGQPMVNVAWLSPFGTFDGFVLPWFRERTFAGAAGRLRLPVSVDTDGVVYESDAKAHHVDWALRWSHYIGGWDIGISHFSGTAREPRLESGTRADGSSVIVPHYDLMQQTGVDAQYTTGSWLLKFEGVTRETRAVRSYAMTAGFEYTVYQLVGAADLGVIGEYLYDDRTTGFVPFDDDIAVGGRMAFNDTHGSELLAVAVTDRGGAGSFVSVEGSRRVGSHWTLGLETRGFLGLEAVNPLYALRRDGYLGVTVTRFF